MTRLLRITGFLLIGTGVLVLLVWAIRPLRHIWPWLLELNYPLPSRSELERPRWV